MRLMMEVTIPAAAGNESIKNGSMASAFKNFTQNAKPEAAYFYLRDGKRAALFILEETDQAKLMTYNEALFAAFDAEISIQPVLSQQELQSNF